MPRRTSPCCRAVSRPRRARRESGPGLRADRARARVGRLRRGRPAHRRVLPLTADQDRLCRHITLESIIDAAFERRAEIIAGTRSAGSVGARSTRSSPELNAGRLRVAEKIDGAWVTHQWIKKAVLLYFRTHDNQRDAGRRRVLVRQGADALRRLHRRAVPRRRLSRRAAGAVARTGAFIGRNVVLMPSYVNIGAYVDEGTMVDTWATVGSCAQIGKNVHLSGGVGIGGVLEPLQANPTIIEDTASSAPGPEIVEGVIVEAHSVISMGVFIGQSTKIYDRATGEVHYGRVPVRLGRRARQPAVGRRQATRWPAPSSSSAWTRRRARRRRSTSCCGTDAT